MKISTTGLSACIVTCVVFASALPRAAGGDSRDVLRTQIEADWQRQDELRDRAPAPGEKEIAPEEPARVTPTYPVARTIERGLVLAANLTQLGADTTAEVAALHAMERLLAAERTEIEPLRDTYFRIRWIVRNLALKNPLLDFDSVLFVKRAPGMFPHVSDQYYGWWSRPGGGLYRLVGLKTEHPEVRCLTQEWAAGNFLRPDIRNTQS